MDSSEASPRIVKTSRKFEESWAEQMEGNDDGDDDLHIEVSFKESDPIIVAGPTEKCESVSSPDTTAEAVTPSAVTPEVLSKSPIKLDVECQNHEPEATTPELTESCSDKQEEPATQIQTEDHQDVAEIPLEEKTEPEEENKLLDDSKVAPLVEVKVEDAKHTDEEEDEDDFEDAETGDDDLDEEDERDERSARSDSRSRSFSRGSSSHSVSRESEGHESTGDEGQEAGDEEKPLDGDEDRRNPQYIPKKGAFYEHDDRLGLEDEVEKEPSVEPTDSLEQNGDHKEETKNIDLAPSAQEKSKPPQVESRPESDHKTAKKKSTSSSSVKSANNSETIKSNEKVSSSGGRRGSNRRVDRSEMESNKWGHDLFQEDQQKPKSKDELVTSYGYDIRSDDSAPKALRRRKYGREPAKYTRNWSDADAYSNNKRSSGSTNRRKSSVDSSQPDPDKSVGSGRESNEGSLAKLNTKPTSASKSAAQDKIALREAHQENERKKFEMDSRDRDNNRHHFDSGPDRRGDARRNPRGGGGGRRGPGEERFEDSRRDDRKNDRRPDKRREGGGNRNYHNDQNSNRENPSSYHHPQQSVRGDHLQDSRSGFAEEDFPELPSQKGPKGKQSSPSQSNQQQAWNKSNSQGKPSPMIDRRDLSEIKRTIYNENAVPLDADVTLDNQRNSDMISGDYRGSIRTKFFTNSRYDSNRPRDDFNPRGGNRGYREDRDDRRRDRDGCDRRDKPGYGRPLQKTPYDNRDEPRDTRNRKDDSRNDTRNRRPEGNQRGPDRNRDRPSHNQHDDRYEDEDDYSVEDLNAQVQKMALERTSQQQHGSENENNARPKRYSALRQQNPQPSRERITDPLDLHPPVQNPTHPNQLQQSNQQQLIQQSSHEPHPAPATHHFYDQPGLHSPPEYYSDPSSQPQAPHNAGYGYPGTPEGTAHSAIDARFLPQQRFISADPRLALQPTIATGPSGAPGPLPVLPNPGSYLPPYTPSGYPQYPPPPAPGQFLPLAPVVPPAGNGPEVYRGGVTYYDTSQQQPLPLPPKRPKNIIPILPPPDEGPNSAQMVTPMHPSGLGQEYTPAGY